MEEDSLKNVALFCLHDTTIRFWPFVILLGK